MVNLGFSKQAIHPYEIRIIEFIKKNPMKDIERDLETGWVLKFPSGQSKNDVICHKRGEGKE